METAYTLFHDIFKTKIFKKNLPIIQFGMPKKMTPKSQAKFKHSLP